MCKGNSGFGFIRYGKTHRDGNDCHEGRILLYSQIPKNRRPWHPTPGTRDGQEALREKEDMESMDSMGKNQGGSVNRFRTGCFE